MYVRSPLRVPGEFRMNQDEYYLKREAFLCRADDHYVALQLENDRYVTVGAKEFEALGPWLIGWTGRSGQGEIPEEIRQTAIQLEASGVLTTRKDRGKPVRTTEVEPAEYSLAVRRIELTPSVAVHAPRFAMAATRANSLLKRTTIDETVKAVLRHRTELGVTKPEGMETTSVVVARFNAFRLFFPRKYLCLFDSLAMIEYLARYRLEATWVFGVQANPFAAHCWVQQGKTVLNDTLETARMYTPVMAV